MSDAATGALDTPHVPEGPHEFRSAERLEVFVEHGPEQTLVKAELEQGSVIAAVDVGELGLQSTIDLADDLEAAICRATTPASGGEP